MRAWVKAYREEVKKHLKQNVEGVLKEARFFLGKQRFRPDVFQDFLRRLVRQSKRKVFLIVDGYPVHRAKKIKKMD